MIGEPEVGGYAARTLASDGAGGIEAALVPGAGMVRCSLLHDGEELLAYECRHRRSHDLDVLLRHRHAVFRLLR